MIEVLHAWHSYIDCSTLEKLWDKVWWVIANILGNTLGAREHAKNALRAWVLRHQELDVNTYD
jgi:hypothetical protein